MQNIIGKFKSVAFLFLISGMFCADNSVQAMKRKLEEQEEQNENGNAKKIKKEKDNSSSVTTNNNESSGQKKVVDQKMVAEGLLKLVQNDNIEKIMLLLSNFRVEKDNTLLKNTTLLYAVWNNKLNIVEKMIELGASPDVAADGNTLLSIAITENYTEIARLLIEKKADLNKADTNGKTPLINAISRNNLEIVTLLLDGGAAIDQAGSNDGMTPLLFAISQDFVEIVKVLIQKKADINKANKNDVTSLMVAARRGNATILNIILKKYPKENINITDNRGWTAVMFAARSGHLEMVQKLVSKGATFKKGSPNDKITPLMLAARSGNDLIVDFFIKKGADINKEDKEGDTALSFALQTGNKNVVDTLINHGANTDNPRLILHAIAGGLVDVAVSLVEDKGTPLTVETFYDALPHIMKLWGDKKDIILKLFASQGIDINSQFSKKHKAQTILNQAILDSDEARVDICLKLGANVNKRCPETTKTPLMLALWDKNFSVIDILLSKTRKSDFNIKVTSKELINVPAGRTLVHCVVNSLSELRKGTVNEDANLLTKLDSSYLLLLKKLLLFKPDFLQDKNKKTALDLAKDEKLEDVCRMIESKDSHKPTSDLVEQFNTWVLHNADNKNDFVKKGLLYQLNDCNLNYL